ncbi:protein arginine kinase [Bacillus badius]|uniref:Protein-arginine kinase n=1 Tax=Bacillus badius TaxID=1455 RepID=A0ABR5AQ53_BACBA|nr:protein arginine kinase [Bacillus badius]KIL72116.1 putative ATP:guanido phosphotransferase YacI [Bacillus badius]KIL76897.1 putative ATP:guanido phosphotransferase YacI [Bacillus badius]KZO00598.1 ATP--guanido phosphotransferase [Bacillus badius]KZR60524.1 ATP--guanido phosphotransferase [Bacillus badius]MED0668091.1 protein arginine kinase [Bacillus badius]
MSLERFINQAVSSWMSNEGPHSDIVLSSRVRLARNLADYHFPLFLKANEAKDMTVQISEGVQDGYQLERLEMEQLSPLQKRVLVEKHLISPYLADNAAYGAVLLSESEDISIMINEEDHIRIQCLAPGLQLKEVLEKANELDDAIEGKVKYAFDEQRGYLTSCPTNVGTGLRASVMIHLPGLVLTQQLSRIIPAISQLGFVVRGIYGEGSEALGNIFQISNQLTLGKSEADIVDDLISIVHQIIAHEKSAREVLANTSSIRLEDKVFRSYGVLTNSRIIETKEAAQCLSDVRLGIDIGYIRNISRSILNELMILTQPGFLQQYAGGPLHPEERDIRRAALIRERLQLEENC